MAEELVMPRLSDTMERGTIARWLVKEGDRVTSGDVLAEIETDKAVMELQAYDDGVLLKIIVGDGETADLGAPIALVGEEGEAVPDAAPAAPAASAPAEPALADDAPAAAPAPAAAVPAAAAAPAVSDGSLKASPVARRLASEHGIDLRVLAGRGSGPDGRIVRVDVERLVEQMSKAGSAPPASPTQIAAATAAAMAAGAGITLPGPGQPAAIPEGDVVEPSTMLKIVARRMAEAKVTAPHFYLQSDVDMAAASALRRDLNAALEPEGVKVSFNDMVVRASALALMEHPQAHRSWVDGKLVYHRAANIGVAVALDDGLIVPVVRRAHEKSLAEISRETKDLAERARAGRIKQAEIEGGTFTVSNLGMFGVGRFMAIINVPEPMILAVGAIEDRVVAVDGAPAVRPMMTVTISMDHRAGSGADGAKVLAAVRRRLEQPLLLLV